MSKIPDNFTRLAKNICRVTGKTYDEGSILIHKRLRDIPEEKAVIGYGFCPEVQEKFDEGYIALVGIDPEKSEILPNGNLKPGAEYRTGNIIYIKSKVFSNIFNTPAPKDFAFCEQAAIDQVALIQKHIEDDSKDSE